MDDRVSPEAIAEATKKPGVKLEELVDAMLVHAEELHNTLRAEGSRNDIKDRITCLKYLNDVVKLNITLKKAATNDPAAAGSAVRKYADAFTAKNAAGIRRKNSGRRPAAPATDDTDDDFDDGDHPTFSHS